MLKFEIASFSCFQQAKVGVIILIIIIIIIMNYHNYLAGWFGLELLISKCGIHMWHLNGLISRWQALDVSRKQNLV